MRELSPHLPMPRPFNNSSVDLFFSCFPLLHPHWRPRSAPPNNQRASQHGMHRWMSMASNYCGETYRLCPAFVWILLVLETPRGILNLKPTRQ